MKKLLSIILLVSAFQAMGQKTESVTLTVSGIGKSKQDAQTAALRSAIEQAFGVFISSKTEIIDDKLTKDEIVSITNGSVEKFNIISEVQLSDLSYAVTIEARVSVTKLTDLCSSKGIQVEINGSIIAANIKLQKLNEQAEYKAILNLCNTSWDILSRSVDFKLEVGNPEKFENETDNYILPMSVNYETNKNRDLFATYFTKTLQSISMKDDEYKSYISLKKPIQYVVVNFNTILKLRNPNSMLAIKNLIIKSNKFIFDFIVFSEVDTFSLNGKKLGSKIEYGIGDKCRGNNTNQWLINECEQLKSSNMSIIEAGCIPVDLNPANLKRLNETYLNYDIYNIYGTYSNTIPSLNVGLVALTVMYERYFASSEFNVSNLFMMRSGWIQNLNDHEIGKWYYDLYAGTEPLGYNVTYFVFDKKSKGKLNIRHKVHLSQLEKINKYNIKATHN